MRSGIILAAVAGLLATTAPASAQGFLKRLAERAISEAEAKAEAAAGDLADRGSNGAGAGRSGESRGASAPEVMTPRPVGGGAPRAASPAPAAAPPPSPASAPVRFPSRLPKPPGFEAVKKAYDEFGKVRCTSCEGGYAYDGWPVWTYDEYQSRYNGREQRLGALPVGHVHRWKGEQSNGSLTIVAEENVDGFKCRRLLYRLERGSASAERPGLVCWGYSSEYASKESWNGVY